MTDADPLVKADTCLLLSYWGPYSWESEINQYWAELALSHATEAISGVGRGDFRSRSLLVWLCSIIRGRMLAFHSALPETVMYDPSVSRSINFANISRIIQFPEGTDRDSQDSIRRGFILNWKLSEIMARLFVLRDLPNFFSDEYSTLTARHAIQEWDHEFLVSSQIARAAPLAAQSPFYILSILRK